MTEVTLSLDVLAVRVREAHDEVELHGRATVAAAIRAGEALAEAKAAVPFGSWLSWLAENFPGHQDTASNYMRLAANSERVPNLREAGSMREALALVAGPSRAPRDPEPDPVPAEIPGQTDLVTETAPEAEPQAEHHESGEPDPTTTQPAPADGWATPDDEPEDAEVVDAEPVEDDETSSRDRRTQAVLRAAETLHVPTLTHPDGLAYALPKMSAADRNNLAESINFVLTRSKAASKIVKQFEENHA